MPNVNPNASKLIDEYIESRAPFASEICTTLRELIHQSENEVLEDWKWNSPIFQKNEMVCGFAAFKKHVSLTFFKGSLICDMHQLFSDDCSAQHMRTIKFTAIPELNKNQLIDYLKEAFLNSEQNAKHFVKKTSEKISFEIPEILQKALNNNNLAKENFDNMAYTYRKEYALHISNAKRETTKLSRLENVILNLERNIKMHEQYKC